MILTSSLLLALGLTAALLFNGEYLHWYSLSWLSVILAILGISLKKLDSKRIDLPNDVVFISLLLLAFWIFLSQFWATTYGYGQGLLFVIFLGYRLFADDRHWDSAKWLIILVGLAVAVITLYQGYLEHVKPVGTFYNRNSNGAFLSLVSFLLVGWYLNNYPQGIQRIILLGLLFILFLAILTTGGRGVFTAFAIGSLVFGWLSWRVSGWKKIVQPTAVFLFALVVNMGLLSGQTSIDRYVQLGMSSTERLLIWPASIELAADAPWYGLGSGAYWYFYPGYRYPGDGSGGFYAHNDYLQILIELGYPGLLLLIAVMIFLAIRYFACRSRLTSEEHGMFAGLVALSTHSLVTFNLYIVPILIVTGLYLARLHGRLYPNSKGLGIQLKSLSNSNIPSIQSFLSIKVLRIIVVMISLIVAVRFFGQGLASMMVRGEIFPPLQVQEIAKQVETLNLAARLDQSADSYHLSKGMLLKKAAQKVDEVEQKELLYRQAEQAMQKAIQLNPVRAENYYQYAMLYFLKGRLGTSEWKIAENYAKKALSLNPRLVAARILLLRLWITTDRESEMIALIKEGLLEPLAGKNVNLFLEFGAKIAMNLGRSDLSEQLLSRLKTVDPK